MPEDDTDSEVGREITERRAYDRPYDGWEQFFDGDPEWARRYDEFVEYVIRRDCEPEEGLSRKIRELLIVAFAADGGHVDVCRNHILKAQEHGAAAAVLLIVNCSTRRGTMLAGASMYAFAPMDTSEHATKMPAGQRCSLTRTHRPRRQALCPFSGALGR